MAGFPDSLPDDPLPLATQWLEAATATGQRNPNAMALATTATDLRPSVRMVLLKALSKEHGYAVFYSNRRSRKGREIAANPHAAGVLYWEPLGRQLRLEGRIVLSPDAESDAYFATRPVGSQINAWVSEQSSPIATFGELEQRIASKAAAADGAKLPRPGFWGGYRLWLDALEFWIEGRDRFHHRVRYQRPLAPNDAPESPFIVGGWSHRRLQP